MENFVAPILATCRGWGEQYKGQADKHKKLLWLRFCGKETDKRAATEANCPPAAMLPF